MPFPNLAGFLFFAGRAAVMWIVHFVYFIVIPKNYTEDFKQLGYNNIDSIDNF